ncbi:DegT/DnrJ/EryC1/StrS family aminotransferase [Massilia sp. PWRC2]|uniref:DegT/DnrJ/EryC1/StrS family aminotransferase n=1 Tax=Massilia sp. PWRC2 TaxID=2804626 RepID=UPI003CFAC1D9
MNDRAPDLLTTTPFLPFALPDIGEEEIAEVVACLRSGWVTTGPKTRQFESDFAAYLGGGVEAVSVNSATAGLHLALEALGIGAGDEVIVPTMTFTATAEIVRYLGASPILADVDGTTLNLTADAIQAAITPRTKAVIPVHYAGLPCDMDAILSVAAAHNLRVVEDAAHAFPTLYRSQLVGTLGSDATVFSFYANKTMTTGEGGMVVTRAPELAARVRMMRIHGIRQDAFSRYTATTPSWFYEVVAAGYKYNLTDIAAAIGVQQLRKIDAFLKRRQLLAANYAEALGDLPLVLPADADIASGSRHAWHLYVIRLRDDAAISRDALISRLCELGIGTSVHFIPLHRHPVWRTICHRATSEFPAAEASFASMLSLPLYTRMSDADQRRVIMALRATLSGQMV